MVWQLRAPVTLSSRTTEDADKLLSLRKPSGVWLFVLCQKSVSPTMVKCLNKITLTFIHVVYNYAWYMAACIYLFFQTLKMFPGRVFFNKSPHIFIWSPAEPMQEVDLVEVIAKVKVVLNGTGSFETEVVFDLKETSSRDFFGEKVSSQKIFGELTTSDSAW